MQTVLLTTESSGEKILVSTSSMHYARTKHLEKGKDYTEIRFASGSIYVKESIEEINTLINSK